jgi:hypothetical protein
MKYRKDLRGCCYENIEPNISQERLIHSAVLHPFAAEKVLRQKTDAGEHLDYSVEVAGCTAVLQARFATRCSMDVDIGPAFIPGTLACCVNLL